MEKVINGNAPDETKSVAPDNSHQGDSKRKSFPVRELKFIIEFVSKIYLELGPNHFHSRKEIADKHGLAVESIKQTLSTAQQYGLLDIKHGTGYQVSQLFIKIFKPLNPGDINEQKIVITESLRACDIFDKLLNDYNGHVVPTLAGVTNNILRTFDLKEANARKVAEIFYTNLRDYNLVDSGNNLSLSTPPKSQADNHPKGKTTTTVNKQDNLDDDVIVIPIPLRNQGAKKIAHLHLPHDYTDLDLKRISKFVNALKDEDDIEKPKEA